MASGKEVRTKIKSVENTQKITRAMDMVAASKMRKTQERVLAARPYAKKMSQVIRHLAQASSEYNHSYLTERETKRICLILVSPFEQRSMKLLKCVNRRLSKSGFLPTALESG